MPHGRSSCVQDLTKPLIKIIFSSHSYSLFPIQSLLKNQEFLCGSNIIHFLTPEPSFSPPTLTVLKIHGGDDAHIFLNANDFGLDRELVG